MKHPNDQYIDRVLHDGSMSYYEILEIPSDATAETIKRAFRRLANVYHPDKTHNASTKSRHEEVFKKINEAHSVLSNPKKKQDYDFSHKTDSSSKKTGTPHSDDSHNSTNAKIHFEKTELNFGILKPGESRRLSFFMENLGGLPTTGVTGRWEHDTTKWGEVSLESMGSDINPYPIFCHVTVTAPSDPMIYGTVSDRIIFAVEGKVVFVTVSFTIPKPTINIQPSTINFGTCMQGQYKTLELTIDNSLGKLPTSNITTSWNTHESRITLTHRIIGDKAQPTAIVITLSLSLSDSIMHGVYTNTLNVTYMTETFHIPVTFTIAELPQISVVPEEISFGRIRAGQTKSLTFTIQHVGGPMPKTIDVRCYDSNMRISVQRTNPLPATVTITYTAPEYSAGEYNFKIEILVDDIAY